MDYGGSGASRQAAVGRKTINQNLLLGVPAAAILCVGTKGRWG